MLDITLKINKGWLKRTRVRLVLTYLSIILLTLIFISTYILASISQYIYNQKKVQVLANANVAANLVVRYVKSDSNNIKDVINQLNVDDSTRVIVADIQAKVLFDTSLNNNIQGKILVREEVMSALKGQDVVNSYKEKDVGTVVQAAVSVISDSKTIGVVYISSVAKSTDDFLNDIKLQLIIISAIVCVLIGVFSSVMADIVVSPVEKFTELLENMEDDLNLEPVTYKGTTEVERLALAFNKLISRLDQMEDKRRAFVSDASHELKTPLSSIKLLSESILSMGKIDADTVREFMTDISGEIDRLNKIIERLLTLTKLDTGSEKLSLKVTDVNEMAQRIVKSLTPVAENKNINLNLVTGDEILAMVDREKLWQVVYNLTDNAIKYTLNGGIVEVGVYRDSENLRIEVTDNGVGISEEDSKRIFDRFYRVDKARSRESGGTGLGLSIVKDLVEMHGGTINVESVVNRGTRMTVVIPRKLF